MVVHPISSTRAQAVGAAGPGGNSGHRGRGLSSRDPLRGPLRGTTLRCRQLLALVALYSAPGRAMTKCHGRPILQDFRGVPRQSTGKGVCLWAFSTGHRCAPRVNSRTLGDPTGEKGAHRGSLDPGVPWPYPAVQSRGFVGPLVAVARHNGISAKRLSIDRWSSSPLPQQHAGRPPPAFVPA
jgi:hypothetical protein